MAPLGPYTAQKWVERRQRINNEVANKGQDQLNEVLGLIEEGDYAEGFDLIKSIEYMVETERKVLDFILDTTPEFGWRGNVTRFIVRNDRRQIGPISADLWAEYAIARLIRPATDEEVDSINFLAEQWEGDVVDNILQSVSNDGSYQKDNCFALAEVVVQTD